MKTTERESLEAPEPDDDAPDEHEAPATRSCSSWESCPVSSSWPSSWPLLIKTFLFQAFFIPSGSMEPTLMPGDRVLVQRSRTTSATRGAATSSCSRIPNPPRQPDRGVVGGFFHWLFEGLGVQQPDNEDFIKRVIGLPGDTVRARTGRST